MPKRVLLSLLLLWSFSARVFSQEVSLTEAEYQELMSIIRTSVRNSEQQRTLIAGLREVLTAQEAELRQALSALEQSEADLTELKASLSRIRTYLDGLNEYCLALESENAGLRSKNRGLKAGLGVSSGAAGVLVLVGLYPVRYTVLSMAT
jgi:septal ring factor EnvC (AmiA/AmiB activator)